MRPLMFIITGGSGTGKTATITKLRQQGHAGYAFHDIDELHVPDNAGDWSRQEAAEHWLQVAKTNSSKGVSTVLGGTLFPEDIEAHLARAEAPHIHYLILEADDESIARRLTNRISTQHMRDELRRINGLSLEEWIPAAQAYRHELHCAFQNSSCDWTSFNTSGVSEEETIRFVLKWIESKHG